MDRRNARILSGTDAVQTVDAVTAAADAAGAEVLRGATPTGNALCGAAVYTSSGRLRLWSPGDAGPVLIVDAITASDMSATIEQKRLERFGVQSAIHIVETASTS